MFSTLPFQSIASEIPGAAGQLHMNMIAARLTTWLQAVDKLSWANLQSVVGSRLGPISDPTPHKITITSFLWLAGIQMTTNVLQTPYTKMCWQSHRRKVVQFSCHGWIILMTRDFVCIIIIIIIIDFWLRLDDMRIHFHYLSCFAIWKHKYEFKLATYECSKNNETLKYVSKHEIIRIIMKPLVTLKWTYLPP